MPSPTELARAAQEHSQGLRQEFELLKQQVDTKELLGLRDRFVLLESRIAVLEKYETDIHRIGILEHRINELDRAKEDSDKRRWQFVYIFAGAAASLLATVVVQLVLMLVKKP